MLNGENMKGFRTYERLVQVHVLSAAGKNDEDIKRKLRAIGSALYKNLLMMGNSIIMPMEQSDVRTLAVEDGANLLLNHLRTTRFSEGKLSQLPRVYKESVYKCGPAEPMATFIAEQINCEGWAGGGRHRLQG